jgi:arylsulfatase A-like enzyme
LLPLTLLLAGQSSRIEEAYPLPQNQNAPNVLIVLFDTLSAKHMSLHGYQRDTTPNLARFAQKATVYHRHYAGGNFTTPGTASLLTGTYPWTHRAFDEGAVVAEIYKNRNLFGAFSGNTYDRIAYTNNFLVEVLLHQFQKDIDHHITPETFSLFDGRLFSRLFSKDAIIAHRTFEEFLLDTIETPGSLFSAVVDNQTRNALEKIVTRNFAYLYPAGVPSTPWKMVYLLEHMIDGIKGVVGDTRQPFLAYFHLFPPHHPYTPRRDFIGLFDDGWVPTAKEPHFFSDDQPDEYLADLRRLYDEYIAFTDAEFGRLYEFLAQNGILDNTHVVVTSDHGELFERGVWGHMSPLLYEPLIHVPLIISKPGQQNREDVYTPTSCVDLLPTLLRATGHAIPDWVDGEVLPTFSGGDDRSRRGVFSVEARINPRRSPLTKGTVALIKDQYKLIHYFGYDGYESQYELYDVVNDPEEMEDLYPFGGSTATDLQSELEEELQAANRALLRMTPEALQEA